MEKFEEEQLALSNEELYNLMNEELSKLCNTGGRSFTMTVPVRVKDTDMLIAEMMKRFKEFYEREGANKSIETIVE